MLLALLFVIVALAACWVAYHMGYMDGCQATYNKQVERNK